MCNHYNVHFLMIYDKAYIFSMNNLISIYDMSDQVVHRQCSGAAGRFASAQLQRPGFNPKLRLLSV